MSNNVDDILTMAIPCPECGEEIGAKISAFKNHPSIDCPSCGVRIDLTDKERRAFIDEFAKAAASVLPSSKDFLNPR